MAEQRLRLGTRASALARWQAQWVAEQLLARGVEVELVPITTRGDASTEDSVARLGGTGVFTKELERALLADTIDLAVHSLKDLPTDAVEGLRLAAVPERASPLDALISREGRALAQLPPGAVVGTGSLRRRAQLLHVRPDLEMRDVRGNVDTRIQKLGAGQYDAIVLAEAGLTRLGEQARITEILGPEIMLPAVGQGALGIETRLDDGATNAAIAPLDHAPSRSAVLAERSLLRALLGGCLAPVGAWAREQAAGELCLDAVVVSADGRCRLAATLSGSADDPEELGRRVASILLAEGAAELIEQSRTNR